jgi:hypothetical protein
LEDAVTRFTKLREQSLAWLRSLDQPDWNQAYQHRQFGPFLAGDLLAAWVAHDSLHLRQIAKRFFELTARDAGEYSIRYAGQWKQIRRSPLTTAAGWGDSCWQT